MNTGSLVLRIVAIIAGISAGALFFVSQGKLKEKHTELTETQSTLSTTKTSLADAQAQAADLSVKLKTAERQGERLTAQVETLRNENNTAMNDLNGAKSELSAAKGQVNTLKETIQKLNDDLSAADTAVAEAKANSKTEELAELTERFAALNTETQNLKDDLSVAEAKLKTYTAGREKKAAGGSLALNTSAAVRSATIADNVTIASINSSDGIIVLDAAPELGLEPGMNVTLIKDLKALGKVRVAQVNDNLAVANVLPGSSTSRLEEGAVVDILR